MKNILALLSLFSAFLFTSAANAEPTLQDGIDALSKGNYTDGCKILMVHQDTTEAMAQYLIGVCYEGGAVASPTDNKKMAASYYLRAASQNLVEAQIYLGIAYMNGVGVPHDVDAASHWFHKAADQFTKQDQGETPQELTELAPLLHGQLLRLGDALYGDPKNNIQYFLLRMDPEAPTCKPDGSDGVKNCQERWDMYHAISAHITPDLIKYRAFEEGFYDKWIRNQQHADSDNPPR